MGRHFVADDDQFAGLRPFVVICALSSNDARFAECGAVQWQA
jgi:hypothetical protein